MNAFAPIAGPRIVPQELVLDLITALKKADQRQELFDKMDIESMTSMLVPLADTSLLFHIVQKMLEDGSTLVQQDIVTDWIQRMWPEDPVIRPEMRIIRFLEEALELGQAMGVSIDKIDELIGQVYSKEPGEVPQEIAGSYNTLLAVAASVGVDAGSAGRTELDDAWDRREEVRAKSKTKVKP
jgi:hypothetical protein